MTGVSASPTAPLGLRPEPVPVSAIRRVSTDAVRFFEAVDQLDADWTAWKRRHPEIFAPESK